MPMSYWHSPRELLAFIFRSTKRIVVLVIGLALVVGGVALLVLPGPGILLVVAGLAVLASEFAWAETMLNQAKRTAKQATGVAKRSFLRRRKKTPPGQL